MESKPVKYNWGILWELSGGILHREDGPAVVWNNGKKEWFINDKRHRLDGPATERPTGKNEWWINDYCVTKQIHIWAKEFNIDLKNLTDEDKQMIVLYWGDYGK